MTSEEKKLFCYDLIATVQEKILRCLRHVPENWDGIELRRFIADAFAEQTMPMSSSRMRDYKSDRACIPS
jgi:hypothetical protein